MAAMEISATHQYPKPPAATFAMLTDPAFLEAVCVASEPLDYSVYADGLRTGARRTMKNHPSIEKFTGPTITVTDEVAWGKRTATPAPAAPWSRWRTCRSSSTGRSSSLRTARAPPSPTPAP